ncbi:MAG: alpha-glucosidase/alpha-galactosidase [Lachnospiraceae bacterium]|nr:alpha-glucosidase/alpha-galactosidase [Lachnospiraceae bacterium]
MIYVENKVTELKIAYIGGGSRGWAWGLMSDLADCNDISGDVYLYDIDLEAAKANEIIGNKYNNAEGAKSVWNYHAVETIDEALSGADFVIISILPGTFDEMESDVHTPEKYGIYQSVGDTSGPGGIVRAMRTIPMYEYFAEKIRENCPKAWIINFTNPMTQCVKAMYRVFPEIKAFGCCHEVFGTQKFLARMVEEMLGETKVERHEIKVNPVAVNHFTWLTKATYHDVDLFPYYKEFCQKYKDGYVSGDKAVDDNWMNNVFESREKVKIDLYNRFGWIAAAGDRHLAEFCEGKWYLENPERVKEMCFGLTSVAWRKEDLKNNRLVKSARLVSGEEEVKINCTGEEAVSQIRALLGLCELITNVNIPNQGQIPNLPLGAVVETNAVFRANSLEPVFAGSVPTEIYPLVARVCAEQELVAEGIAERDLNKIFNAFANDPLVTCRIEDAKKLFKEMCENTKEYLTMYDLNF